MNEAIKLYGENKKIQEEVEKVKKTIAVLKQKIMRTHIDEAVDKEFNDINYQYNEAWRQFYNLMEYQQIRTIEALEKFSKKTKKNNNEDT